MLFVLQDAEEAGYFYHDLTQMMGTDNVLFFPSSYRRAVKYAQRDAASEILRTEVLSRINVSATDKSHSTLHTPRHISSLILRPSQSLSCRSRNSMTVR